jgi:hypothetical protein
VDSQVIAIIVTSIFSAGASWAVLNQRVKALEDKTSKNEDHDQRLTRLETKLDILLEHLIKD